MNLNNLSPDFDETPLHSTGFAKAANGNSVGAATSQTFSQRRHIENNRQNVRRYHDSMLVHGHHRQTVYRRTAPEPPSKESSVQSTAAKNNTTQSSRFGSGPISDIRHPRMAKNFSEPSKRNYNPFA